MSSRPVHLGKVEKLALLQSHAIGGDQWESLQDRAVCFHCDQLFTGEQVRVYSVDGEKMLECGTPDCDGSPLDWSRKPCWRSKNRREAKMRFYAFVCVQMKNVQNG